MYSIIAIAILILVIVGILYCIKPSVKSQKSDNVTMIQPEPNSALVMFYADWCGACKNTKPHWEELTQNFDGYNNVKIMKINADENNELVQLHGVSGLPTIKFCPNGVENSEGVIYKGDRTLQSLVQFLQQVVQPQQ